MAAANSDDVAFLALLGCPGVSPARQMRYHTDELLRRAGFDSAARGDLLTLRLAMEDLRRGAGDRQPVAQMLADCSARPWFPLAYLPKELPAEIPKWTDMDFDPEPFYAQVRCPVLLIYGVEEECVPVNDSVRVWQRAANQHVSIVRLPGLGHWPGPSLENDPGNISADYTRAITEWFSAVALNRG